MDMVTTMDTVMVTGMVTPIGMDTVTATGMGTTPIGIIIGGMATAAGMAGAGGVTASALAGV